MCVRARQGNNSAYFCLVLHANVSWEVPLCCDYSGRASSHRQVIVSSKHSVFFATPLGSMNHQCPHRELYLHATTTLHLSCQSSYLIDISSQSYYSPISQVTHPSLHPMSKTRFPTNMEDGNNARRGSSLNGLFK